MRSRRRPLAAKRWELQLGRPINLWCWNRQRFSVSVPPALPATAAAAAATTTTTTTTTTATSTAIAGATLLSTLLVAAAFAFYRPAAATANAAAATANAASGKSLSKRTQYDSTRPTLSRSFCLPSKPTARRRVSPAPKKSDHLPSPLLLLLPLPLLLQARPEKLHAERQQLRPATQQQQHQLPPQQQQQKGAERRTATLRPHLPKLPPRPRKRRRQVPTAASK